MFLIEIVGFKMEGMKEGMMPEESAIGVLLSL